MIRFRMPRWGGLAGLLALTAIGCLMPTRYVAAQEVGEVFRDCDVCPEMVVVPAGTVMMGSPETEEGRAPWEWLPRPVTIGYEFAVGVYEVTFEEWDACVLAGGCRGREPDDAEWGRGRRPVINVNWEDAWQYADWLTAVTGHQYRLPSEAEWEYVARAGTSTARYWGNAKRDQCRYANGDSSVGCRDRQEYTALVGTYLPNAFGLYDVLGNVIEWVDDCENARDEGAPSDGSPWYDGDCSVRVYRGGSWLDGADELRAAYRLYASVESTRRNLGFRVARRVR